MVLMTSEPGLLRDNIGTLGKVFAITLLSFIAFGLFTDIGYWLVGKWVSHLPKLFFYIAIIVMLLHIFLNKRVVNDSFILYILFYSFFVIFWGLFNNPLNKATLAHLFPLMLPVIGLTFGFNTAKYNPHFFDFFHSHIIKSGVALTLVAVLYYYLNTIGVIPYFGAGTLIAYPVFYCILKKKYIWLFLFLIATVLMGKRSVLIAITLVALIYLIMQIKFSFRYLLYPILFVPFLYVMFYFLYDGFADIEAGIMNRYLNLWHVVVDFDIDNIDLNKLDMVTSGRIFDALAAYNAVEGSFITLFFGRGLGATFEVMYSFSDATHVTHYSHFTPFAYLFLGGFLLMVPVYIKLISLFLFSIFNTRCLYSMLFIYYFVMGIIGGAIFFTDPFVWFVTGVVLYQKSKN